LRSLRFSLRPLRLRALTAKLAKVRAKNAKKFSGGFLVHVPLNRVLHEFARAAERQFFLDVRLVGFDSFHAKVQFFSNLPGTVTFSD
jgi:hypothetical protein